MATHAGYGGAVYSGTNAVAEVKDFTLDITANTNDTTTMVASSDADYGWVKNQVTLKSWTSSLNVIWDDADTGQGELLTEGGAVTLKLYPRGTSNELWEGEGIVTSVSKTVAVDGLVEASITVTGNGHIDETGG
tara:strand:- start:974 stop:1375 length:402 start_codon:yes stop_codon:yes gene_type:complete